MPPITKSVSVPHRIHVTGSFTLNFSAKDLTARFPEQLHQYPLQQLQLLLLLHQYRLLLLQLLLLLRPDVLHLDLQHKNLQPNQCHREEDQQNHNPAESHTIKISPGSSARFYQCSVIFFNQIAQRKTDQMEQMNQT